MFVWPMQGHGVESLSWKLQVQDREWPRMQCKPIAENKHHDVLNVYFTIKCPSNRRGVMQTHIGRYSVCLLGRLACPTQLQLSYSLRMTSCLIILYVIQ